MVGKSAPASTRVYQRRNEKPPYPYAGLAVVAILKSAEKKMTLAQIHQQLEYMFPFFRGEYRGWRDSVRHTLSNTKCFIRLVPAGGDKTTKNCMWTVDISCIRPTWLDKQRGRCNNPDAYADTLMQQFGFTFQNLVEAGVQAAALFKKIPTSCAKDSHPAEIPSPYNLEEELQKMTSSCSKEQEPEIDVVGLSPQKHSTSMNLRPALSHESIGNLQQKETETAEKSLNRPLHGVVQKGKTLSPFNIRDILDSPRSAKRDLSCVYQQLNIEIPAVDADLSAGMKCYFSNARKTKCSLEALQFPFVAEMCQCFGQSQMNSLIGTDPQQASYHSSAYYNMNEIEHPRPELSIAPETRGEPLDLSQKLSASLANQSEPSVGNQAALTPSQGWQPQAPQAVHQVLSAADQLAMMASHHTAVLNQSSMTQLQQNFNHVTGHWDRPSCMKDVPTSAPYSPPRSCTSLAQSTTTGPGPMMYQSTTAYSSTESSYLHVMQQSSMPPRAATPYQNYPHQQQNYPHQQPPANGPVKVLPYASAYASEAASRLSTLAQDHTYSIHMPGQPQQPVQYSDQVQLPVHYSAVSQQWVVDSHTPVSDAYHIYQPRYEHQGQQAQIDVLSLHTPAMNTAPQQQLTYHGQYTQKQLPPRDPLSIFADVALGQKPAYHCMPQVVQPMM